ncbi:dephospho-CoA kinase [Campylobacterota bacterium]|nr:dephospho-CoA kinase [Campylobacterota bacterium]
MYLNSAIVITGGIATGKSEAVKYLSQQGFAVIDADLIAHAVFAESSREIEAVFGTTDRAVIARAVFSDPAKMAKLERITHPAIQDRIFAQSTELEKTQKTYFVDIPLFFEKRNDFPFFDKERNRSLLIYAPRETQIERLTRDRAMSENDALSRLAAQIAIDKKRKMAKWTIENIAGKSELYSQLDKFIAENTARII